MKRKIFSSLLVLLSFIITTPTIALCADIPVGYWKSETMKRDLKGNPHILHIEANYITSSNFPPEKVTSVSYDGEKIILTTQKDRGFIIDVMDKDKIAVYKSLHGKVSPKSHTYVKITPEEAIQSLRQ